MLALQGGTYGAAAILQSQWSWLRVMGWDVGMDGTFRKHV